MPGKYQPKVEEALCAAEEENQKRGHAFNRFILHRARERVTENRDKVPLGPSRRYIVQKEGSRKLCHDGVAACYENRGKSTGRRQEAENDSFTDYSI